MNRRTAQQNPDSARRAIAQNLARLDVIKALRFLQKEVRRRFGKDAKSSIGNNTLYISPDRIELCDNDCYLVAKGPCRVATVLVRKRRKAK